VTFNRLAADPMNHLLKLFGPELVKKILEDFFFAEDGKNIFLIKRLF